MTKSTFSRMEPIYTVGRTGIMSYNIDTSLSHLHIVDRNDLQTVHVYSGVTWRDLRSAYTAYLPNGHYDWDQIAENIRQLRARSVEIGQYPTDVF